MTSRVLSALLELILDRIARFRHGLTLAGQHITRRTHP